MATRRSNRSGWSYAEFARLPSDDGNRYEVIAGELHVTPSPRPLHQHIVHELELALGAFVKRHALGWVLPGAIDVLFAEGDYMAPDLVFVRRERRGIISDRGLEAAPDLIVEVLSESTAERDRGIKRERYAHFGVPEYWVVDPEARTIEVHRPQAAPPHTPSAPEDPKAATEGPKPAPEEPKAATEGPKPAPEEPKTATEGPKPAPEDANTAAGDRREGAARPRVFTDTLTWQPVPGGPTLEIEVPDVLRGIEGG